MAPELQQSNLLETTLRSKDALPFRQRIGRIRGALSFR
jgi:hypothetical protein